MNVRQDQEPERSYLIQVHKALDHNSGPGRAGEKTEEERLGHDTRLQVSSCSDEVFAVVGSL